MTVGFPPQEENIYQNPFVTPPSIPQQTGPIGIDGLAVALLVLLVFLAFQLLRDGDRSSVRQEILEPSPQTQDLAKDREAAPLPETSGETTNPAPPIAPVSPDPTIIVYPYDEYWITQGPHGMSYGHMAIDLAAGKGSLVKSPIFGAVTANYIDQYGNTTLIIENERYQVTILHGDFSAVVGQEVALGAPVGAESNNGYTTDMYGNSCRGRDCGYHSHLNVYDKSLGQNVNPLDVLRS